MQSAGVDQRHVLLEQADGQVNVVRSVIAELDVRARAEPEDSPRCVQVKGHPRSSGQEIKTWRQFHPSLARIMIKTCLVLR